MLAGLASFSMIGFEAAVTLVPAFLCIDLFGINLGNETLFASRCFDHLLVGKALFSNHWHNLG